MTDYVADLLSVTDYPPVDLKSAVVKLNDVMKHKAEDIVHYRDKTHISHLTGTVGAENVIPWVQSKEDGNYPV